ncbi:MAG: RluA family pseudouridine synthase [Puniceicoccales bacterium]|jgi:23S rRNA pseudouridine1911/1915/1917 synthase|nr:RluA family pseudouridine synthase [Puniceicoccales bacterium]
MINDIVNHGDWQEILVESDSAGKRVDLFLSEYLEDMSRTHIQYFFTINGVFVNDQPVKKNFLLKSGNVVKFLEIKPMATNLKPTIAPIDIIFEDESIIVINKSPGITVHAGNGTREPTLVEVILSHCALSPLGGELRPGVVHRLDKETSGVIVFAKTDKAYLSLIEQFSRHRIGKKYGCIVYGNFIIKTGIISEPTGRSKTTRTRMCITSRGRKATTLWNLCNNFKSTALLSITPITGRTHQIRVHLSHIGHPILGDRTYGLEPKSNSIECERVMLHAMNLELIHPVSHEKMIFFSDFPDDFTDLMDRLTKDANEKHI